MLDLNRIGQPGLLTISVLWGLMAASNHLFCLSKAKGHKEFKYTVDSFFDGYPLVCAGGTRSLFTSLLIITRLHCSCQGIYALIPFSLFRNLVYGCFLFDELMLFTMKILSVKRWYEKHSSRSTDGRRFR